MSIIQVSFTCMCLVFDVLKKIMSVNVWFEQLNMSHIFKKRSVFGKSHLKIEFMLIARDDYFSCFITLLPPSDTEKKYRIAVLHISYCMHHNATNCQSNTMCWENIWMKSFTMKPRNFVWTINKFFVWLIAFNGLLSKQKLIGSIENWSILYAKDNKSESFIPIYSMKRFKPQWTTWLLIFQFSISKNPFIFTLEVLIVQTNYMNFLAISKWKNWKCYQNKLNMNNWC